MSKKRIITISRSFGSGGRMIGEELARRLEYHFYDRNLLDLLSEKTGISEQGLESADEKLPQKILDHYVPTRVTDYNTSHYLFPSSMQIQTGNHTIPLHRLQENVMDCLNWI